MSPEAEAAERAIQDINRALKAAAEAKTPYSDAEMREIDQLLAKFRAKVEQEEPRATC